ncbi:MAG: DUF2141 domain-containing protein [Alphaproteobacteria bacterium]|nr:DUF2141 domain-containing protein [Alphaproteobacteria bacterium]
MRMTGPTAVLAAALFWAVQAAAADLRLRIEGVQSTDGVLMIGVYDSEPGFDRALELYDRPDGFIKDRDRLAGAALKAAARGRNVTFNDLPPGRYAVIVFHDANSDGRLDRNFLGVPVEGYGFSNTARGFLGPPDFEDALVEVTDPATEVVVRLGY